MCFSSLVEIQFIFEHLHIGGSGDGGGIPVTRVSYNRRGGWVDLNIRFVQRPMSPQVLTKLSYVSIFLGLINTCGNRNGWWWWCAKYANLSSEYYLQIVTELGKF